MPLAASVRRTIRRHDMIPAGGRVVVALSGGPDSVALLHLLRDLERTGDLVVAGVAHFNHQLRAAAVEDERFCREMATALDVPIEVGRGDVRGAAIASKRSIEDAARQFRYAFLHEAAARLGAGSIAVGHTRDDQAETVLLRILRGAGTRGLGAIRPKAGSIVRPLIDIDRAALRRYVAERNLTYREDETNADVSIPRNRIRHELLPHLQREYSPNIVEVLAREAASAIEDEDRLQNEAIDLAGSIVLRDTPQSADRWIGVPAERTDRLIVDVEALSALHPAMASRVVRLALAEVAGERFVGFDHVRAFLDFARQGRTGSVLHLPGQQARTIRSPAPPYRRSVVLERAEAGIVRSTADERVPPKLRRSVGGPVFSIPLSIPGEVVLAEQGWTVSAGWANDNGSTAEPQVHAAMVQGLSGPLAVRSRKPGDRFRPQGLGGRARKLQDFMVDRRIARSDRDRLPLVVDGDDRIVWIVGHAVAEGFRAAAPSPGVILLKARHLGGEV